jgi:hypothetical protein
MNELPVATSDQIDQMNKIAEKNYGADVNKEVIEEVAPQDESNVDDTSTVQEEISVDQESVAEPQKAVESSKETNLRILRERAEKAEREREQLMRFVSERASQQQQQIAAPQQEEDLDFTIAPDELAEGKHLSKLNKKIQQLEKRIAQGNQQSAAMGTEARLKATYPDFEKVVSQSNVASLSELYPEIAKTIGESSDLYNKAVSAYTMIKKFGIHQDETFVQEKAKVQANAIKPRPLASLSPQQGESPLSKANAFAQGLTPELAKQLWKETKDAMKNG